MEWYEALILGLVQGLTEFLPVSSSGHLEIGKVLLNVKTQEDLSFAVAVHGATVLSILVVFFQDIRKIFFEALSFTWNESTHYVLKLIISMIPVAIVGIFFREEIESFFSGNVIFVGFMLLITSSLLVISFFTKQKDKSISYRDAFILGISQAFAVLPGISRSGATIVTGLILGNKKYDVTQFSFLMVLLPIIAANFKDLISGEFSGEASVGTIPLLTGFIASFLSGLIACKWMIRIVKKGKLIYFGYYCFIIGLIAIISGLF